MPINGAWRAAIVLALGFADTPAIGAGLPEGFVYLADIAPDIEQDMRYATKRNFTGDVVAGYEAAACILTRDAAEALKRVHAALKAHQVGLKVYDCYRPTTAVARFVAWSRAPETGQTAAEYYPGLEKSRLFKLGYIATRSGHSRGSTVDLAMVPLGATFQRQWSAAVRYADCAAPYYERAPDTALDFGTGFDCFSALSATRHKGIPEAAQAHRMLLMAEMEKQGFENYSKEWWHFSLRTEPFPNTYFDFPVVSKNDASREK